MVERASNPIVTEHELGEIRSLIEQRSGILFDESRERFFSTRVREHMEAKKHAFGAELIRNIRGSNVEYDQLLERLLTQETRFRRYPESFEALEQKILPEMHMKKFWENPRALRIWSAGCSTGEEPYSLAMVLLKHLPVSEGWQVDIFASDLSTRVLERARAGIWPIEKAEAIPGEYRRSFMLRGVRGHEGMMKAGPELRAAVRFAQVNLRDEAYAAPRNCDMVFCRNVLIYFDQALRARITSRLIEHLQPGGYLFLGHAETLHSWGTTSLATVIPTVYMRPADEEAGAAGRKS
jgi:chemotaxis protein methyltransferase CheR